MRRLAELGLRGTRGGDVRVSVSVHAGRWRSTAVAADAGSCYSPAARAALRASPPRPVTIRVPIEPSMRCIPGPTCSAATACTWLSRRNRATRA